MSHVKHPSEARQVPSVPVGLRHCTRLVLVFVFTSHWSLVTGHFAEAAISKGDDQQLEVGGTNSGGGVVTSSSFRQQLTLGEPLAGVTTSSTRFKLFPGLLGATFSGESALPLSDLDIGVLYAKTDHLGDEIPPSTWQTHNGPVIMWEPPHSGADVAGYSYAFDEDPDDQVDTVDTYLDVKDTPQQALPDGKRKFSIKAVNGAGSSGDVSALELWIDTTPPQATPTSPASGGLVNAPGPVTAAVSDTASGVQAGTVSLTVNGSAAAVQYDAATGTVTAGGAGWREGVNNLELRVMDVVGNAQAPVLWSVTVDTQPPLGVVLINTGASMTTSQHVTLSLEAPDEVSGVDRMLISNETAGQYVEEPFVAVRELWALTPVRGIQQVYVKFVDKAGNISAPYSDDIELVLLSPETNITGGPAGFTPSRSATFTYLCPGGGCVYSYAFDSEEWSEWSEATTASAGELVFGNHYFRVKAAQESNGIAGVQPDEEDPTPAERAWTVGVAPFIYHVPQGPPVKVWRLE